MKNTLTISLLILLTNLAQAQTLNVQLSEKHLNKIEKAEDGRTKLKKYRKFYSKDSLKQAKRLKKYWKQKSDSLAKAKRRELLGKYKEEYAGNLPQPDSSLPTRDGLQKAKSELPQSAALNEAQQELHNLAGGDLGNLKNKDSLASYAGSYAQQKVEKQVGQLGEMQTLQQQQQELQDIQQLPQQYKKEYEGYTDPEKLKEEGKTMATEKAAAFMAQHGEKLEVVQKKISHLQRKYISLPNSNDLSTAVKRTSLKDHSFRERLVIGGNFNINNIKPLSLDLSPQLGYRFNKRFIVGIGGTYRQTFTDSLKVSPAIPANSYGFRAFSSYDVFKSFFAYGEYEQMSKEITAGDRKQTEWVDGLLLGIGREISVHPKLNMNVMMLYNLINEQENPIYGRRWVMKVGFQLSELALLTK